MSAFIDSLEKDFQKSLEEHYCKTDSSHPLYKFKSQFWSHFQETGLPARDMEAYRYIKLRKLYSQNFLSLETQKRMPERSVWNDSRDSTIVLVNGEFVPELSSLSAIAGKATIVPLHQAQRTYAAFFSNYLAKVLKTEKDPFVILNGALSTGGVFIYIPPGVILNQPLHIINVVNAEDQSRLVSPRMHFFIGSQAQCDIMIENVSSPGEKFLCTQCMDFVMEEAAQVRLTQVDLESSETSWVFDAVRAVLKKDCVFHSVAITRGSETRRHDYRIELIGENSEASLNALWALNHAREAHMNVLIDHQAPHCRSQQLFKGILEDRSRSSFEGKILVRSPAQKTDAFQLNNNLLLSDLAQADSKPNLEIFADDVKASHGATVGQLNKEQLFYLQARGYSLKQARKVLIKGFCQQVMDRVQNEALKEKIKQEFDSVLRDHE